jgi:glycosyltransferase involved in cell wall biosynthesis
VELVTARKPPRVRTFALTDLVEALSARAAAQRGIAEHRPHAVIYCSITAALLWPRPDAIFLDSIAAENRPGRHGLWQRPVERRRLREASLLLTWSESSLDALQGAHARTVVVPPPVYDSGQARGERDIAAIAYAGDPVKRRLDLVLEAWARARRDGETLVVAGTDRVDARPGVQVAGILEPSAFHALLGRARVFVAAPRREDFGIAALEALSHGCMMVSTPAPGPYPALEIARRLDDRLVGADLATAIRTALDDPRPGYAARADQSLEPLRRDAIDRTVADQVLPGLLAR